MSDKAISARINNEKKSFLVYMILLGTVGIFGYHRPYLDKPLDPYGRAWMAIIAALFLLLTAFVLKSYYLNILSLSCLLVLVIYILSLKIYDLFSFKKWSQNYLSQIKSNLKNVQVDLTKEETLKKNSKDLRVTYLLLALVGVTGAHRLYSKFENQYIIPILFFVYLLCGAVFPAFYGWEAPIVLITIKIVLIMILIHDAINIHSWHQSNIEALRQEKRN